MFCLSSTREKLEVRIGKLENENTELAYKNNKLFKENEKISGLENTNDQLWQAKEKLTK